MTQKGRECFDNYLLGLLNDADARETELEIHLNQLIEQAKAADVRIADIEKEVGKINDAIEKNSSRTEVHRVLSTLELLMR